MEYIDEDKWYKPTNIEKLIEIDKENQYKKYINSIARKIVKYTSSGWDDLYGIKEYDNNICIKQGSSGHGATACYHIVSKDDFFNKDVKQMKLIYYGYWDSPYRF
jgi:predicted transcriptional regulator